MSAAHSNSSPTPSGGSRVRVPAADRQTAVEITAHTSGEGRGGAHLARGEVVLSAIQRHSDGGAGGPCTRPTSVTSSLNGMVI